MKHLPWVKWFCSDWLSDPCLARCSPATRGIWKDALDNMVLSNCPYLEGSAEVLSRLCRCKVSEFLVALKELKSTDTAVVEKHNGNIRLSSRRLVREFEIKALRSKAGHISATKRLHTPQHTVSTEGATPSASVSVSSSLEGKEGVGEEGPDCPENAKHRDLFKAQWDLMVGIPRMTYEEWATAYHNLGADPAALHSTILNLLRHEPPARFERFGNWKVLTWAIESITKPRPGSVKIGYDAPAIKGRL